MPYVRISLLKGKSPAFLRALSESVHQALVDSFDVPPDDRFQVIQQCEPHELVFDRHYMGGPRTDDFVLLHVTAGRSRSAQTKRAFYRRLTELLSTAPGIAPRDVMVVIETTEPIDWSFAHGIAAPDVEVQ
ncbi:tautomerase family protein [Massilia sp. TS11]|uniref:tautomerase family protein n=1 Tax=Massilia sp. TS11 TaxID=2908003 RepID=UPI001EDA7F76|nr:tautomerase family protein [Massilia sp. TS11]MCG2585606.1 tautomerase family protein [Massilia sp. TS11]